MGNRSKIVVIGLDGGTWDLLDVWMKQGIMPNLSRMVQEGTAGVLESTPNPSSVPGWVSLVTGMNPGKHGVFSLTTRSMDGVTDWVSGKAIRSPRVWDYLGEQGRSVCILNMPLTYPPEKVNGFLMCDYFAPRSGAIVSYPAEFHSSLSKEIGGYSIHLYDDSHDMAGYLLRLKEATQQRSDALQFMMQNHDLDFYMLCFETLARTQRGIWKRLDPREPEYNDPQSAVFRERAFACFTIIDDTLGKLMDLLGEDGNLFVVSEHGECALKGFFMADHWLSDLGLLEYSSLSLSRTKLSQRLGLTNPSKSKVECMNLSVGHEGAIQWDRTLAFAGQNYERAIRISDNLKHGGGRVHGMTYNEVREQIEQKLMELKDKDGLPAVAKVLRHDEIYHGPYVSEAADLLVEMAIPGFRIKSGLQLQANSYFKPVTEPWGDDQRQGVLAAWGRGVKRGGRIAGASVMDITPTVLHLSGVPVPDDVDGRVLAELFGPTSVVPSDRTSPFGLPQVQQDLIGAGPLGEK